MARLSFDEWIDALPEDLAAVGVRAGVSSTDRNPTTVALFALGSFPWLDKKEARAELVEREDLEQALRDAIADNGGDVVGTMVRLEPFAADGKKLRSWAHTEQPSSRTNSWKTLPAGEKAAELSARGLAEAVAGMTRSQVNFLDKTTDVLAVMGQAVADSQQAQTDLMDQVLDIQRDWLDSIAEDVGAAAEDLANAPEARDESWRDGIMDLIREVTGMGFPPEDEPEDEPEPAEPPAE